MNIRITKTVFILIGFIFSTLSCSYTDNVRKMVREGNKAYKDSIFDEAEIYYRKALDFDSVAFAPNYNIANVTYQRKNYGSALTRYKQVLDSLETKEWKARTHHNIGNSYLKQKQPKIDEAIESYKDALRNNPNDMETKYNLVYAMKMKQQQQQQQQNKQDKQKQQQKDKQDKKNQKNNTPKSGDNETKPQKPQTGNDKEQEKNKKDKEKQKEGGKEKDKKDNQQGQQPSNKNKPDDKKGDKQKNNPAKLSKEDAKKILDAMALEEKKSQEKVQKNKAKHIGKSKSKKNW